LAEQPEAAIPELLNDLWARTKDVLVRAEPADARALCCV
jgi:hypothetical protein